jgi:hypothetical protein
MVEERNFVELAGEFACDNFRERHEAGFGLGGMVRQHWKDPAPLAVQTQAPNTKVLPRLKATVGLK